MNVPYRYSIWLVNDSLLQDDSPMSQVVKLIQVDGRIFPELVFEYVSIGLNSGINYNHAKQCTYFLSSFEVGDYVWLYSSHIFGRVRSFEITPDGSIRIRVGRRFRNFAHRKKTIGDDIFITEVSLEQLALLSPVLYEWVFFHRRPEDQETRRPALNLDLNSESSLELDRFLPL